MKAIARGIRGDLAISARPACLAVLILVSIMAGLSSAVIQDASYAQLASARLQISQRSWEHGSCVGSRVECRRARALAARESRSFLNDQEHAAAHVASLQTPFGALEYAARFMALGFGAIVIALLGTLLVASEWARGTMSWAFSGMTPAAVAWRRLSSLVILAAIAFLFALAGAVCAAVWGRESRPLGEASDSVVWQSLLGAGAVVLAYTAITSGIAWSVRDSMRTLLFTTVLAGGIAFTTQWGAPTPGAAVASAVGIHRVLEIEVGYLWIWPALTFHPGTASPERTVPALPWAVAILVVVVGAGAAALLMNRSASRLGPAA